MSLGPWVESIPQETRFGRTLDRITLGVSMLIAMTEDTRIILKHFVFMFVLGIILFTGGIGGWYYISPLTLTPSAVEIFGAILAAAMVWLGYFIPFDQKDS